MGPLIGIPPCLDERGRWRSGRNYHYIDRAYARAIEAAGGVPVYLPEQADAAGLVERIDGLLVPGGGDFEPQASYPADVRFQVVPSSQLGFDARLLDAAVERARPVLGICYGMQLLALRHGGSLWYDIESDAPEAGEHQLPEPDGVHGLRVEPATRLAAVLGPAPGPVNSRHHQAVREPGAGLCVAARADDGLIEAIESEGGAFCIGVQWHPEQMAGPHRERLFGGFVAACRNAGARPEAPPGCGERRRETEH